MKRKKPKEIILTGKDEMNLAEFPFASLARRISKSKKTIEWTALVPGRNGKLIKQEWTVTGSDKFGLPHSIDNDFYLGIMLLLKRSNFENRTGYFVDEEFLKAIGKGATKITNCDYKRLEQAFDRMKGVMIKATNTFWDNKEKCYLKSVGAFGIIDNYYLVSKEKKKEDNEQPTLPYSSVTINEVLFQSIKSSYIKSLDLDFYFSLETPLTKRLFRYLDKNRYKKETYEIELLKLASLLPLDEKRTWDIKRRLKNPHQELIDKGFLEKVNYGKTQTGEHKVIYSFAKAKPVEPEQIDLLIQIAESSINEEIKALIDRGVTEVVAYELVEKYPDRIMKQVDMLDYLIEKKDPKVSKNPAGFLCMSIEKDYAPPKGYISKEERLKIKEQQEKQRQEARKQEAQKRDQITAERKMNAKIDKFIANLSSDEQETLQQQAEQRLKQSLGELFSANKGFVFAMEIRKVAIEKYCLTPEKLGIV